MLPPYHEEIREEEGGQRGIDAGAQREEGPEILHHAAPEDQNTGIEGQYQQNGPIAGGPEGRT